MKLLDRAILITLLGVVVVVGLSFWTAPAPRDARADSLALHSAQLESIVKAQRAELLIVTAMADSFRRVAQRSSGRAARADAAVRIDTTLPAPRLTGGGGSPDTVRMGWVMRVGDTTHYAAPLFFTEAYELVRRAWQDERALRVYDSTYTIPLKDTLIAQLAALADTRAAEAALWERKAHPRCGRRCGIALGVLGSVSAAVAANQLGRLGRAFRGS